MLKDNYAITPTYIKEQPRGWSALAFSIEDKTQRYFLKVYQKSRPSIVRYIEAIDRYIPVVRWLQGNSSLKSNIATPLHTNLGYNKCEDSEYVYLLSQYVDGITIGERALSLHQVKELARILGVLHAGTSIMPNELRARQIEETFHISFCDALTRFLDRDLDQKDDALRRILSPHINDLLATIDRFTVLAGSLQAKSQNLVLCHADAHSWNIIQGQELVLVDWECLRLAPPEQDLVLSAAETYADVFLAEYLQHMDNYDPDFAAFEFYLLKRKLEDIWEWILDLRAGGLVKAEDVNLSLLKSTAEQCNASHIRSFRRHLDTLFAGR